MNKYKVKIEYKIEAAIIEKILSFALKWKIKGSKIKKDVSIIEFNFNPKMAQNNINVNFKELKLIDVFEK
jgi:predicted GNAT superfamily acetyltransferase